ncbi:MAG TPA: non-homologous end-joining DNA ligase [bacterium]|nr:non-homologous end-joining DNA ligase [bacterium]
MTRPRARRPSTGRRTVRGRTPAPRSTHPARGARGRPTRSPVQLTHADKVFWPDEGYTKGDLAEYYAAVFPRLQPYVDERLLTLERCPDGLRGQCFYQREAPMGLPRDTPTRRVRDKTGHTTYVVGGRLETQLALVNLGCIAVHVWPSRRRAPHRPDWMCFDIDPASGEFADAARAALLVKARLDELGLRSFPKTSGSRGIHIFVPIRPGPDNAAVLAFAEAFCRILAGAHPRELTVEARVRARRGRVYLDPFRNGFAQTVVAPFSVRRRPKAPISTPLDWSEVTPALDPSQFNLGNYVRRLEDPDPWRDIFRHRQSLAAVMRAGRRSL